jgi:hypothetical protein
MRHPVARPLHRLHLLREELRRVDRVALLVVEEEDEEAVLRASAALSPFFAASAEGSTRLRLL